MPATILRPRTWSSNKSCKVFQWQRMCFPVFQQTSGKKWIIAAQSFLLHPRRTHESNARLVQQDDRSDPQRLHQSQQQEGTSFGTGSCGFTNAFSWSLYPVQRPETSSIGRSLTYQRQSNSSLWKFSQQWLLDLETQKN